MTSDDNMDDVLQGIIDDDLASQRSEKLTSYMDEFEADAVIVYYDENGKEVKKEEEADAEGDDSKQDKAADSESTDGDATEDTAAE